MLEWYRLYTIEDDPRLADTIEEEMYFKLFLNGRKIKRNILAPDAITYFLLNGFKISNMILISVYWFRN
jgi:hypothetical protein